MKKHTQFLTSRRACSEAVAFADQHRSLKAAWEACTRPGWMLWLLSEIGYNDQRVLRLFACRCVRETPLLDGRKAWDLLTDPRSRNAVEIAERYAVGEATDEELDAAGAAAWDVWDARDAWASARAAAGASARDVVWASARAAAWASAGAGAAAWAAQVQFLREAVPWPVVAKRIKETQK